jgi:hypothetical protein
MGNEVEARTQRVRNHLQRAGSPDRQLTNAKVGSTVNLTAPAVHLADRRCASGAARHRRGDRCRTARAPLYGGAWIRKPGSRTAVGPLPHDQWDAHTGAILDRMPLRSGDQPLSIFTTWAHHPRLMRAFMVLARVRQSMTGAMWRGGRWRAGRRVLLYRTPLLDKGQHRDVGRCMCSDVRFGWSQRSTDAMSHNAAVQRIGAGSPLRSLRARKEGGRRKRLIDKNRNLLLRKSHPSASKSIGCPSIRMYWC